MALVAAEPAGALVELDVGDSPESLAGLVESQRELFHAQVDQLQKLVVAQCKLTGVNPLAQEMAAGALSIKIGKRPRDLLNPKAVNYMQSVFSIKDTIGKKETREISALCGVTLSQVREFFAGQRSRVRKFVRLSREKATRSEASKTSNAESSFGFVQLPPTSKEPSGNAGDIIVIGGLKQFPDNTGIVGTAKADLQEPPNSADLTKVEEGHPSLLQEIIPGVDSDDKKFLENIFNLMRKEQTFSGQVKLLEWVLCIHNSAVLHWFTNNGGVNILATWLSQAATEEQTTVLLVIFKVLYHLPLHKALPVHMSVLVPVVNRLRFYRTSDISNRAKILLSRWSKVFIRSQAFKKTLISSSKTAQEAIHTQSASVPIGDELWQSKVDIAEDILALTGGTEINRTKEPKQELKLLTASSSDSTKKHDRTISSTKFRERRKVLLVEQPDQKAAGRIGQVVRAVSSNHSRPMSADDIQKAKMRAMYMQHKYGKAIPSSSGSKSQKIEDIKASSVSHTNNVMSEHEAPQDPQQLKDENSIPAVSGNDSLHNESKTSFKSNPNSTSQQASTGILKCKLIQWKIPPEMPIPSAWSVGAGENSKEVDVQIQRNRREKETAYSCLQDIPPNPKDPWDLEMDFDESLTPEIPFEQPPDADVEEGPSCSAAIKEVEEAPASEAAPPDATSAPSTTSDGAPEPDLELLAVLLKNPDLVFALTSNQGKTMTSEEMVAVLDMLKRNGVGLTGMLNELARQKNSSQEMTSQEQEPPASLPSPTPPSEAARSSWRSDFPTFSKVPVLQPHFSGRRGASSLPGAAPPQPPPPVVARSQTFGLTSPAQAPTTVLSMPQVTPAINSATQNLPPQSLLPTSTSLPPRKPSTIYRMQQTAVFDSNLPIYHYQVTNTTVTPLMPPQESFGHSPSTISGLPTVVPSLPNNLQRSQPPALPNNLQRSYPPPNNVEPPTFSSRAPAWPGVPSAAAATVVRRDATPDQLMSRPHGVLEASAPSHRQRYFSDQNSYSAYPSGSMPSSHVLPSRSGERNGVLNGSELETWNLDDSRVRSPEFRAGWCYNDDESRRDSRWNKRPEWSRQSNPGNRDHHRTSGGGKRWRDHEHGRRR